MLSVYRTANMQFATTVRSWKSWKMHLEDACNVLEFDFGRSVATLKTESERDKLTQILRHHDCNITLWMHEL